MREATAPAAAAAENPYQPHRAKLVKLEPFTADTALLRLEFLDRERGERFTYRPGQFIQVSALGTGEAPISLCSSPTRPGYLEICVRRVGRVTQALHRLSPGALVGVRGPYGNGFPVEKMRGKDLLLIAGGLGMAPLRSLLWYALDRRGDFGRVILLYGASTPRDVLFRGELQELENRSDVRILITVDRNEEGGWPGRVGVVTTLFEGLEVDSARTVAVICVPPVAFKFVVPKLLERNFKGEQILMSLERKMQCGIGKCGNCNVGSKHTCLDGPVFTYWDAMNVPGMI